jgi:hypothetical protein
MGITNMVSRRAFSAAAIADVSTIVKNDKEIPSSKLKYIHPSPSLDTFEIVSGLKNKGLTEDQSTALLTVFNDILNAR